MSTVAARCVSILGLGLACTMLRADSLTDEAARRAKAQAAIVKLSENLDSKDVVEMAKAIVRDNPSEAISSIFRLKSAGGLGIGIATKANHRDSIERLVIDFALRKTTTEAELDEYLQDYVRVAKVLQAMAELAPHRATNELKKQPQRLKEFEQVTVEFKHMTADFRKAIEERDPKKVRLAARKLHSSCCHCHDYVQ